MCDVTVELTSRSMYNSLHGFHLSIALAEICHTLLQALIDFRLGQTMGLREPSSADHGGDVLYDIGKCEEVGRYMVAKRDLQPGEVIFTDQPAVIGPDSNSLPLCTVCWRYRSEIFSGT